MLSIGVYRYSMIDWGVSIHLIYLYFMTAKLSQEKVSERIEQLRQRNILLVSPYTKTHDRHIFKCLLDGHEWKSQFTNIFHI
jgi:hypothetical protein